MARDVYAVAERWLKAEGVDVGRALAAVDRAEEAGRSRLRADADQLRHLALDLKRAEAQLLAESRGFTQSAVGFTRASLAEAEARAGRLRAALEEACTHDRGLVRAVRRAVS